MVRKTERELKNKAFKGAKQRVFSTLNEYIADRKAGRECESSPWADVLSRLDMPANGWTNKLCKAEALQMMKENQEDFACGLLTRGGEYLSSFDFVRSCKGLSHLSRAMPGCDASYAPTEWELCEGMFREWCGEGHGDGLSPAQKQEKFGDYYYAFRFALEKQFNPEFKLNLEEAMMLWQQYIGYERLVRDVAREALNTLPVQPQVGGLPYVELMEAA
jgi:hypothetical protein